MEAMPCKARIAAANWPALPDGESPTGSWRFSTTRARCWLISEAISAESSGTTASDKPVVIDRVDSLGAGDALTAAVKARGCFYLGFSSKCAPEAELANPFSTTPEAQKKVSVVVNLNVRSEARDDAGIIGIIPQNSCVTVERCLTASERRLVPGQFRRQERLGPQAGATPEHVADRDVHQQLRLRAGRSMAPSTWPCRERTPARSPRPLETMRPFGVNLLLRLEECRRAQTVYWGYAPRCPML